MVAPEYRYPDSEGVPQYLRGKTASDAAQMLQGLVESYGRNAAQAPAAPITQAADDDLISGAQLRQAQQQALAQVSPWLATVADQQATMSYTMAKQGEVEVFKKYEPEIIQVLQSVPRQNWTLDVIKRAVTLVKGSHVDELAAEKVRALEATMASTMRSTGRAGSGPDSSPRETIEERLEKAPPEWVAHAKAVGITPEQVREFCFANDVTPDEFFKQFGAGLVSDAVADVNFVRSVR